MSETARIADQLRRAFSGDAWHGDSLLQILDGVTAAQASARPVPHAHSIWELVLHLSGTYSLVLRRLNGDATDLSPEEDWPDVESPSTANWTGALNVLRSLNQQLRAAVQHFSPESLDQPLGNRKYSAYEQFIGVTQHDLYHAGQIVLLRRALRAAAPAPPPRPAGEIVNGQPRPRQ